jgi:acetoin:2,6-dichlorophenolindophenol oxidoreductase subunit alpha
MATDNSQVPKVGRRRALDMFAVVLTIRQAELRLSSLFADGEIPGFIHLSVGQEAISAGIMAALEQRDTISSNHRGHGHAIARGVELASFFQEIMAKEEGCCRGRGGSMHVADAKAGMLGANGIVGAGIPIALGGALAHQVRKTGAISVVFFGDGALAEGVLHESLNLANLWKLPLLFVCENNGWSEFCPTSAEFTAKLTDLAAAFGIPAQTVDGNDLFAVYACALTAVAAARDRGPQVLECMTRRVRGHFEGDPQRYRDPAEIARAGETDPVARVEATLLDMGVPEREIEAVRARVTEHIDAAVAAARKGTPPSFSAALADVYTAQS